MTNRANKITEFIKKAGLEKARRTPLTGDASTRRYERLTLGEKSFLLMDAPQSQKSSLCPPFATQEDRKILGYNASARLAGNDMHCFAAVARSLQHHKLSAPIIHHIEAENGFAILEDLGTGIYAGAISAGQNEKQLYQSAINALVTINQTGLKPDNSPDYYLHDYDMLSMLTEVDLITQWYWSEKTGSPPTDAQLEHHSCLWHDLLKTLTPPSVLVLRDYHAENLLWLPRRKGVSATGLIDFQDALWGNHCYDLVSLLEDARRDVTPSLVPELKKYFCNQLAMNQNDQDNFEHDYAIMGAQRNAKILGIFVRLAKRDNKPHYLDLLPRVENLFRKNLSHPALEDLYTYYNTHMPTLFSI